MKLVTFVAFVAFVAASAAVAHADNRDKADALFKQGKTLMGEKRYADACKAFEKSHALDPGIGSQLNIGKCYEEWGKIGRAYLAYKAAEKLAKDQNDSREPKIHELIVALEPNVPRLTIKLPKDASTEGLVVKLDNRPVKTFGEPIVVDPGPHLIEWSVNGGDKRDKVVPLDRGSDSEITLDVPRKAKPDDRVEDKPSDVAVKPTEPPGRTQRMVGIALGGAGIVAVGVSSFMTLSARGKYNDALAMYCGGMKNSCDTTGLEITHDARSTANKATIVFLVGAAMVGGGAALYFLAPKGQAAVGAEGQALYITPSISPDGVGLVLGGKL